MGYLGSIYLRGCWKELRKKGDMLKEEGLISFCIEEFERLNKKLQDYTSSNPGLEKLTIQEVVSRLALEMQIQNNISIMALRALMGESKK